MDARQPTILCVDDDEYVLRVYSRAFQQAGFRAQTATTGQAALRLAAAGPDLIVLDIRLPDISGFEVCRRLKADPATAAIPVLHLSAAFVSGEDKAHGLEGGADAYLVKPVHPEEMLATVRALLRAREAESALRESEERFRGLMEQAPLSIQVLAPDGRTVRVNRAWEELWGVTLDQLEGYNILHDPQLEAKGVAAYIRRAFAGEAVRAPAIQYDPSETFPDRAPCGDPLRWVAAIAYPLKDAAGQVREVVLVHEDITARRRAEEALQARARQQAAVAELGRRALGSTDPADLMSAAAEVVAQTLGVEHAAVLEPLPGGEALLLRAGVGWPEGAAGHATVGAGELSPAGYALRTGAPVVAEDLRAGPRFGAPAPHAAGVVSSLSVPVPGPDGPFGVLSAETGRRHAFTEDDTHFLQAVAHVLGTACARRAAEEARLATEAELRAARRIQQRLFPAAVPRLAGLDVGGVRHGLDVGGASYPAVATGGDYYDYIPMPDGTLAVVVGDVSGHGFGPALLMAEARAYLRALAWTYTEVGQILTLANRILAEDIEEDRFITLAFARVEPRTRSLVYASAGHLTGYVLDAAGEVRTSLPSTGPPLGVSPEGEFPSSGRVPLEAGALVILFTDGLVDTRAPDGTPFGTQRALGIVRCYRRDGAQQIVNNLYHAARAFAQNQPQLDDITAIVIRVDPGP